MRYLRAIALSLAIFLAACSSTATYQAPVQTSSRVEMAVLTAAQSACYEAGHAVGSDAMADCVIRTLASASTEPAQLVEPTFEPPLRQSSVTQSTIPSVRSTLTSPTASKACCKVCSKGKPCGNSCIARNKTCRVGPGCAC